MNPIIQRLTGRFLTIDKLSALLEANDLSIAALIAGARTRLARLSESAEENDKEADKYADMAEQHREVADDAREKISDLQDVLSVFEKEESYEQ